MAWTIYYTTRYGSKDVEKDGAILATLESIDQQDAERLANSIREEFDVYAVAMED